MFVAVARKLSQLRSEGDLDKNITNIINLCHEAKDMMHNDERFELTKVFVLASEKVTVSAAFGDAFAYFEARIGILGDC